MLYYNHGKKSLTWWGRALKDSPPPSGLFPPPALCGLYQPDEVAVASEGYHVVIAIDIPVNIMARRLEGNIGKYAGRGSTTPSQERRCEGRDGSV